MKVFTSIFTALLTITFSFFANAQYDDVYWDPFEESAEPANSNTAVNSNEYEYAENAMAFNEAGNTYQGNEYALDDYYDYSYSSNLRRFYDPVSGVDYYDDYYTDYFFYSMDPTLYGTSIYNSYNPYAPWQFRYYNIWANPAYVNAVYNPISTVVYDPFTPFPTNNPSFNAGFNAGINSVFNNGFNGGFNGGFNNAGFGGGGFVGGGAGYYCPPTAYFGGPNVTVNNPTVNTNTNTTPNYTPRGGGSNPNVPNNGYSNPNSGTNPYVKPTNPKPNYKTNTTSNSTNNPYAKPKSNSGNNYNYSAPSNNSSRGSYSSPSSNTYTPSNSGGNSNTYSAPTYSAPSYSAPSYSSPSPRSVGGGGSSGTIRSPR